MNFSTVDIHTHLSFDAFDKDREAVIARFTEQEIAVIAVGVDLETSKKELAFAKMHENVFACIGLHPMDNPSEPFDSVGFETLVTDSKVVAIGECGLDYSKIKDEGAVEKKRQKDVFETQIDFAVKYGKPLMVHARDTHEDIIEILKIKKQAYGSRLRGNIHFFTGTEEVAKRYLDLDFTLSFSGVITFVPAYERLVSFVPLDMMHAETDSPFAAPMPYRGKRNESAYVVEVVKKIAEIKKLPLEEVQKALVSNAKRVFSV